MQKPDGNFHNYLGYQRQFLDVDGSEDAAGRTLWACGCTVNSDLPKELRLVAKDIFLKGLPKVFNSTYLRLIAAALSGIKEYCSAIPQPELRDNASKLADVLVAHFRDESKEGWRWFEPYLTYDNARLPQALFAAYILTGEPTFLTTAQDSMAFLLETQMVDGVFVPIGNAGWYRRDGERALFDQQPIEASAMVDASIEAYTATRDKRYIQAAEGIFGWYLGKNNRRLEIYNSQTAGCRDGLSEDKVNPNQGAESSVCYLLARLRLEEVHHGKLGQKRI